MTDETISPVKNEEQKTPSEMREFLHQTISDVYATLMGVVQKLPSHPAMKANMLFSFDSGLLWARQIIDCIEFVEKSVDEVKKQEDDGA